MIATQVKSFISGLDIQGFVGYNIARHAIIVAFRGSVDINNWLANVDTVQVSYPRCTNCKIHQGFYNGFKAVQSIVNSQISLLLGKYPGVAIYITGHSLGGALASVAATELLATFGQVDLVYTTGQPRVGNSYYAQHVTNNFQFFRLVHYADLVPHCPASGIIMAFKHGGTEAWYTEDMQRYQLCASEDSKCANSIGMMARNTKDHSLLTYYITLPTMIARLRSQS